MTLKNSKINGKKNIILQLTETLSMNKDQQDLITSNIQQKFHCNFEQMKVLAYPITLYKHRNYLNDDTDRICGEIGDLTQIILVCSMY